MIVTKFTVVTFYVLGGKVEAYLSENWFYLQKSAKETKAANQNNTDLLLDLDLCK